MDSTEQSLRAYLYERYAAEGITERMIRLVEPKVGDKVYPHPLPPYLYQCEPWTLKAQLRNGQFVAEYVRYSLDGKGTALKTLTSDGARVARLRYILCHEWPDVAKLMML
jgi:hypothetical protein